MLCMAREEYPNAHDIAEVAAGKGSASDKREVANAGGLAAARKRLRKHKTVGHRHRSAGRPLK
jgi:hypothetical protein